MWDLPDIRSTWEAIGISFDSFDEWKMKNLHDFSSDSAAKLMYLDSIYQHAAGRVSKSLNGDSCPLAKEVRLACDQLSITGCSDYADRFIRGERLSVNLHHDYVEKTKCYKPVMSF